MEASARDDVAARAREEQRRGLPRTLGKLTLIEQIGEGGMARIFLARARGIGGFEKLVVVKQILPGLAEDSEFIARFFQEARLTATLDHPNIAAIHEIDSDRGAYFYSMEYVRGRDLLKVIRRAKQRERAFRLDEIIAIVTGLCAGLHHAHTRIGPDGEPLGIVHRDVSPSNVLLSFDGAVKLADFGVAKARTDMVSTAAGTLRGKIAYMSPEQCRGEAIDRRSDVYAVGALLWEMINGSRLHRADSEIAMVRQIAEGHIPDGGLQHPEASATLERIVRHALAVDPPARHSSAAALPRELLEIDLQRQLTVSSRTVATLMHELFEQEVAEDLGELAGPATVPFQRGASDDVERITPPTATVAPPQLAAGPRPARRTWSTLAIGLGLGAVLGSGALWLARDDDDAPQPRVVADEPVRVDAPAIVAPAIVTPAPKPEPETRVPEPEPSVPTTPSQRSSERTRARSKPRKPAPTRSEPIDLDAPLPPGFSGR